MPCSIEFQKVIKWLLQLKDEKLAFMQLCHYIYVKWTSHIEETQSSEHLGYLKNFEWYFMLNVKNDSS